MTAIHNQMANALRCLAMDAVEQAKSGHPGMPMGMADVATILFSRFLKYSPDHPDWPDRDRFVLSAGHGSMLLYGLLHLTGYADMSLDQIKRFRQLGSKTAGHPEFGHATGIETTTGPLGQGLGNGVGMAIAEQILAARFGRDLVDHYTYVIAGDGCLMEGISHEAISLAGHLGLNKLIVLFDDNDITIDGATSLSCSDDQLARFLASQWRVERVDGHNQDEIAAAIERAQKSDKPSLIACKTVIAYGAPKKAGTSASHGSPLGAEEIAGTKAKLQWPYGPFEIPEAIQDAWHKAGKRSASLYQEWQKRHDASAQKEEFDRVQAGELPASFAETIGQIKKQIVEDQPKIATRQSSQLVLDKLAPLMPELIGGSADLTGSNNTKAKNAQIISANHFSGNYIYYGIREHAMAAAMNGMALHKGVIPFGGTFLVFSDYCRPAMRLSALMQQRVIYVMTHDSIGLGEDGPTHQPVEHLSALRAIPNMMVFRPADTVETLECWALALSQADNPSVLVLTRQALPSLHHEYKPANDCAYGAYILSAARGKRQATILATGSEVSIALKAQEKLRTQGIEVAVISMPCWKLFDEQSQNYQKEILGDAPRIAIEAAVRFGWDRYLRHEDVFIGMPSFGASAPAEDLYRHFGITAEAVIEAVKHKI